MNGQAPPSGYSKLEGVNSVMVWYFVIIDLYHTAKFSLSNTDEENVEPFVTTNELIFVCCCKYRVIIVLSMLM